MELFSNKKLIDKKYYEVYRNYKYNGTDDSLFYRYIVSPLCDKLVLYIPDYIA